MRLARSYGIALGLMLGAGVASAQPASLAARMSTAETASEYWDLSARFESGHSLVARFQITNEGPGQHTAVAIGHVVFPDGERSSFSLLNLWFFELYQYRREGVEKDWILFELFGFDLISFSTGKGELTG